MFFRAAASYAAPMPTCPRCGAATLPNGVCPSCRAAGRPSAARAPTPPPAPAGLILREIADDDAGADLPPAIVLTELPPDAAGVVLRELPADAPAHGIILGEIVEDELIEGFEATLHEPAPVRAKAPPPPPPPRRAAPALEAFPTAACPSCGTPTHDAYATFCEACGARMPRVRRAPAASGAADDRVRCRRCGLANDASRSACTNCGQRLNF